MHGTRIMIAKTKGSNTIQQTCNNWSYLILGKLALTQINKKTTAVAFKPKTNPFIAPSTKGTEVNPIRFIRGRKSSQEFKKGTAGRRYPPKKRIVVNVEIKIILEYSAKKKKTKITAECSVINPATNSDSNLCK